VLFAEDGIVDRLSLYLSLKEDHDERTETALKEMVKGLEVFREHSGILPIAMCSSAAPHAILP